MSDLITQARKALSNFCNGKQTLCIPPQDTDDDMVLSRAIEKLATANESEKQRTLRYKELLYNQDERGKEIERLEYELAHGAELLRDAENKVKELEQENSLLKAQAHFIEKESNTELKQVILEMYDELLYFEHVFGGTSSLFDKHNDLVEELRGEK